MSKSLSELFDLESLSTNLYRGYHQDLGGGRIFGGQVLAQALAAAGRNCEKKVCHSLHAYFLRIGDLTMPLEYAVETMHEGRSFSNRRVVASQQGRPIFHLSCSFHSVEDGPEFQRQMPVVTAPEGLPPLGDATNQRVKMRSSEEMRIDIRPVPAAELISSQSGLSSKSWWLRMIDQLPDSPLFHQCALVYASDFGLLGTAREAHGVPFRQPGVFIASLDHAIWFHRDFRFSDWLLHSMECSNTAQGRGFARGQIFSSDGQLLASVVQEGLIRLPAE